MAEAAHPEWTRHQRLVRPHRGKLALAFAAAASAQKAALSRAELHSALAHRAAGHAIRLAALPWAAGRFGAAFEAIHLAAAEDAHGRLALLRKAKKTTRIEDLSAQYAEEHAGELLDDLSEEARSVVTDTIVGGLQARLSPRQMVSAIEDVIGLNSQQASAVANYRDGLVEDGRSERDVERLAGDYADRLLAQRAEMIERTEIIDASARGIEAGWAQAVKDGFLGSGAKRVWIASPAACPICLELAALDPVGLDEAWEGSDDSYDGPPAHPNCGCSEGLVGEEE